LLPYVQAKLLPLVEANFDPTITAWHTLETVFQTFVVVTFNIMIYREHFRTSDMMVRALGAAERAGLSHTVKWLELFVKIAVNVDLTLSPHSKQWTDMLISVLAQYNQD